MIKQFKMADYFTAETFDFLRQLEHNNNREWFNANKQRYEAVVREPARTIIRAMQPELARFAPNFVADDRKMGGSLMRVYRDVRFGKNKAPYKTNIGIQFRHQQGKDIHAPGFYLHIAPDEVFAAVGMWHPDSAALKSIRQTIDTMPERWCALRDESTFSQVFSLSGDSLKRAPKGYAVDHPLIDDLKRKDFIAIAPLMEPLVMGEEVIDLLTDCFETGAEFAHYLCRAIGVTSV